MQRDVCSVGAVILYVACLDFLLSDMEFDGDAFQCDFGNAELQFDAHTCTRSLSSPSPFSIHAALSGVVRGVHCLSVYRARSIASQCRRGSPHWPS